MKIHSLELDTKKYPRLLKEIADPPSKIFYAGELDILKKPCIAIVGTRKCSPYGENQAFNLARDLSRQGFAIISGLAYGIDSAAHKGALEGRGGTIAVVAQALPSVSPARNRNLAKRILQSGGLIVSEKNPGKPVLKHEYLFRNRIISGLSLGTVVVEAAYRSGALNTANHALDQNREVMAVPGKLGDIASQGPNKLIAKGACLITCAKDVANCLGLKWEDPKLEFLEGEEKKLFEKLKRKPATASELGEHFDGQLKDMYSLLSKLELKGFVRRGGDLRYVVCLA